MPVTLKYSMLRVIKLDYDYAFGCRGSGGGGCLGLYFAILQQAFLDISDPNEETRADAIQWILDSDRRDGLSLRSICSIFNINHRLIQRVPKRWTTPYIGRSTALFSLPGLSWGLRNGLSLPHGYDHINQSDPCLFRALRGLIRQRMPIGFPTIFTVWAKWTFCLCHSVGKNFYPQISSSLKTAIFTLSSGRRGRFSGHKWDELSYFDMVGEHFLHVIIKK